MVRLHYTELILNLDWYWYCFLLNCGKAADWLTRSQDANSPTKQGQKMPDRKKEQQYQCVCRKKVKHRVGFTNPLATSDEKSFAHRNIPGSGGSVLSTRHSSPSPLPCPEPGGTNLGFDVLRGPVRAARLGPRGPLGRPCDQVQPFSTYV